MLSDAKKRKLYDEFGADWAAAAGGAASSRDRAAAGRGGCQARAAARGAVPDRDPGGDGGPVRRLRRDSATSSGRSSAATLAAAAPVEPLDVEAPITVSLAEVYRGTSRTVELPGGRRVEVKVPAGVKEGTVLRVPGLRARVQIAPDPVFTREGKDLRVVVPGAAATSRSAAARWRRRR